jgi:hypothetical protein
MAGMEAMAAAAAGRSEFAACLARWMTRCAGDRAAWRRAVDILTDLDHPDTVAVRAKLHDLDQTTHNDRHAGT